jgi:Flp pilus assembly protein TadG
MSGRIGHQRGSVAIMTGLMIAVLIGFLGLAVDAGRLFVIKSELQTAMDACALAAASQLRPGVNDPLALERAMAYGRTPPNRANFQARAVEPRNIRISFSESLAGPYGEPGGMENLAQFVRCTYPLDNVPLYFMRVVTAVTDMTVAASAVGALTQSQTGCGFPVAICSKPPESDAPLGLRPGDWLNGPLDNHQDTGDGEASAEGCGNGNYCWIDFTNEGKDGLDQIIRGAGTCDMDITQVNTKTGLVRSLDEAWNTRFGIYKHDGFDQSLVASPPDRTGFGYTDERARPVYKDYLQRRIANESYVRDPDRALQNKYRISTPAELAIHGRDRRLVVAPITDCSQFGGGRQQVTIEGWACLLMLAPVTRTKDKTEPRARFEYIGLATDPGTPCATVGLPGSKGPLVPVLAQ